MDGINTDSWIDKDRSFTPSLDNLVYELSKRENTGGGIEHSHSQYNKLGTKEKIDTKLGCSKYMH